MSNLFSFKSTESIYLLIQFTFFIAIISLILVLMRKMQLIKSLQLQIKNLERNLKEADEQAKIIIKTDLELNKIQEELDKKISGLYVLQKTSRALSTTLEEDEIFNRLKNTEILDLGFQKCIILTKAKSNKLNIRANIGFSAGLFPEISDSLNKNKRFLDFLASGKTLSSISKEDEDLKSFVARLFAVPIFIISGIITKQGLEGIVFFGNASRALSISEGEEELVNILSNQIAQSLENARLFEQTWRAQQDLEVKVKQRTQQLSNALQELRQISKRKTDFVSAVSHELRTPLTSIKGYASIILAGALGKIPDKIRSRLEKLNRHADELTNLINDLLDISRIESGKIKMKLEVLDIIEVLDSVRDMFNLQFKQKNIEFSLGLSSKSVDVLADKTQIKRVFINLIGNALKFTPKNGRISILTKLVVDAVQIDISDTGIGIPKQDQPYVFQEFYRVDNEINQELKGTGLGLSLVKNIIEAHKGKIWFTSFENKGTTFSFTLPKAKE